MTKNIMRQNAEASRKQTNQIDTERNEQKTDGYQFRVSRAYGHKIFVK